MSAASRSAAGQPRRFGALALALALGGLFVPEAARGYVRESTGRGLCLWWGRSGSPAWAPDDAYWLNGRKVTWQLSTARQPSGCATFGEAQALVRTAFAQWSEATAAGDALPCTDVTFIEGPTTDSITVGHDGAHVIVWRSGSCAAVVPQNDPCLTTGGCGNIYNCWESDGTHGANVLALTWLIYDTTNGEILDADMELQDTSAADPGSGAYFTCTPRAWAGGANLCIGPPFDKTDCTWIDVGNTVTHEVGHIVGLDHAPDPDVTMAPTAAPGELSKRQLHPDDIAGVCAIYPRGRPTSTCYGPAQGCGCGGPGAGGALLPLLPLLLRRRGRRR